MANGLNWFPKYSGSPLDKMFSGLLGSDDKDPYSSISWMEEESKRELLGDKYIPPKKTSPLGLGEYPEGKDPRDAFGFLVGDMPEANIDPDIIEENISRGKDETIQKLSEALTKIGGSDEVRGPDAYGPKLSGINPRVGTSRGKGYRQVSYDPTNVLTTPELLKFTMDRNVAARGGFPQFAGLLGGGWTSPMDMSTAFRAPRPVFTSSSWNASNLFS